MDEPGHDLREQRQHLQIPETGKGDQVGAARHSARLERGSSWASQMPRWMAVAAKAKVANEEKTPAMPSRPNSLHLSSAVTTGQDEFLAEYSANGLKDSNGKEE